MATTAHQRMDNITAARADDGLKAVTSASTATYPAVATDCTDTSKIPPPTCTDDAANKRRLDMCQAFWKTNPGFFEGTDRVLTSPLSGTTHGMVDGRNPINQSPVGGAQFFVDEALAGFDGFALYWQFDDADGERHARLSRRIPRRPEAPRRAAASVRNADDGDARRHARPHDQPRSPPLTAELAIFANLDQDSTHF